MKFFFDLLPIILFFTAYKLYGIYWATAAAMLTISAQIAWILLQRKKPELMHWITLWMILLLGGATLFFKNELFIKWKPTAVYWVLGLVFALSERVSGKILVQKILEKNLSLPTKTWRYLNTSWVGFFCLMGLLNVIVLYSFDTETWVNFKLFGTLLMTFVFVIFQGVLVSRYLPAQTTK